MDYFVALLGFLWILIVVVVTVKVFRFMVGYKHIYTPRERTALQTVGVILFLGVWVPTLFLVFVFPFVDLDFLF